MSDWSTNPPGGQTGQQPPPGWGPPPPGQQQTGSQPDWGAPPPPSGQVPPQQGWGGPPGQPPGQQPSNGLAIAALVVGIIALLLAFIPFAGFVGIAALILGFLGLSRAKAPEVPGKGMAIAGLVTGGLAVVGAIIWTLVIVAGIAAVGSLSRNPDIVRGLEQAASELEQQAQEADPGGQTRQDDTNTKSVFDLVVGDCFNSSEDTGTPVGEVEIRSCEQPHDNEVFALLGYPAGQGEPFPGADELESWAEDNCRGEFESYVGRDYASSRYFQTSLYPTAESWAAGDREVVCYLYVSDGSTTGSARNSGQ